MFFEVVLLIPGPCWGRLLSGERMDFNSLRLPQASRMLISGAYPKLVSLRRRPPIR
jgi:hypothetical protein